MVVSPRGVGGVVVVESDSPAGLPERGARGGSGLVGADNSISPMAVVLLLALFGAAGLWVYSLTQLGNMGRDVPSVSFDAPPTPTVTPFPDGPFGVAQSGSGSAPVGVVEGLPADGREAVGCPAAGSGFPGALGWGPVFVGAPMGLWAVVGGALGGACVGGGLLYGRRWGVTGRECVSVARGWIWSA